MIEFYRDVNGVEITVFNKNDLYFLYEEHYYNIFIGAGRKDFYEEHYYNIFIGAGRKDFYVASDPAFRCKQEQISIKLIASYKELVDLEGPIVLAYHNVSITCKRTIGFLLTLGTEILTRREYNASAMK